MYKNTYEPLFNPLSDELEWNAYTVPQVYSNPSRWKIDRGRQKSTRLYNEIDAIKGYHNIDLTYAVRYVIIKKLVITNNICNKLDNYISIYYYL
jgi:hypothetical protein